MKVIRKITRNIRHSLVDHLVDSLMNAMRKINGVTTNVMNTMVCNSSNVCSMMDSLILIKIGHYCLIKGTACGDQVVNYTNY
jgi:hypothetical protein